MAIAAMEQSFAGHEARYRQIFADSQPAEARLNQLADYLFETQRDAAVRFGHVCGCPCATMGSEMAGQQTGIQAKFAELTARQEDYYITALVDLQRAGRLDPSSDPAILAREITVFLLGQLMAARIRNDLTPLQHDLKAGLSRLLSLKSLG